MRLAIFRRPARAKGDRLRARYIKAGMTADMTDLLVTMTKLSDMPRDQRHNTPAGRALWVKWMAGCALAEANFEAYARNKAFDEFRSELKRLAALVQETGVVG